MIDLNKPSFIEEAAARAIGIVMGSIYSAQSQQKMANEQHKQDKMRQDSQIKILRCNYELKSS